MKKDLKKKNSKKIIKWAISIVVGMFILLAILPFLYKDKIVALVTKTINNNINATVKFENASLSLFRNFPKATLQVSNLKVINKAPFLGDTLAAIETIDISLKISELFNKASQPLNIRSITANNGTVNIIFNKDDIGNFNIGKETKNTQQQDKSLTLAIENYALNNMIFNYFDENSGMKMNIENIEHFGKGNFEKDILDLTTSSTANISFEYDNINYLDRIPVKLEAIIGIDLNNYKFTFKENTGYINQLPLSFDGFIQLLDDKQQYNLVFKTPTSSFQNALALVPKKYRGNLSGIKTSGNFDVVGNVNGILSNDEIPKFNISITANNASFKYDDLPKSVNNININSEIINDSGLLKDTKIKAGKLTFKVDEDTFLTSGYLHNITTNPIVSLALKGTLNLGNFHKVYPLPKQSELTGILNTSIQTNFNIEAVKNNNFKEIKNIGTIAVSNFKYSGVQVANPFFITNTTLAFNTNTINLEEFNAKTGASDFSLQGNIENFYGFLFSDKKLKGNFNLTSNSFRIDDFLSKEIAKNDVENTQLKIPDFLDISLKASGNSVTYNGLNLANFKGAVFLKEESIQLQNIETNIFGGQIGFEGMISTKTNKPNFSMDLNFSKLNILDAFENLEMLNAIAPLAKSIAGKIDATVNVSGNLSEKMTVDLNSISGGFFGKLSDTKLQPKNAKLLHFIDDKIDFISIDNLNLNDISANLTFKNGEVFIKPFEVKYNDISMMLSGIHRFNNTLNYEIIFNVPPKYLGKEVETILSKLNSKELEKIKYVPIHTSLTGSFSNLNFKTDVNDVSKKFVKSILDNQKNDLLNSGREKIKNVLNGTKNKDSSNNSYSKGKVKNILNRFLQKKKDTNN
ncbi:AsmA-like C-terminal region-containing protein [Polaribacter tangerinus]|uniref:AsmA-like C-terminal region-containing protein n=1 Tax=Polaribacter tangerinus TaxID=1920034 RepID=UPI000B4A98B1|nr:AsmA-like C-terminal region-containing protein [Polaribacter tangerinus]